MSDVIVETTQKKSTFVSIGIVMAILYFIINILKFEYLSAHIAMMSMASTFIYLFFLILQFFVANYSVRINKNTFDFKKVFQALFITLLLYELGYTLGNYIYIQFINPEFVQEFYDRNKIAIETIYVNLDRETKDTILQEILSMKNTSLSLTIQFYFRGVIFSSIAAFIISFITKFMNKSNVPVIQTSNKNF